MVNDAVKIFVGNILSHRVSNIFYAYIIFFALILVAYLFQWLIRGFLTFWRQRLSFFLLFRFPLSDDFHSLISEWKNNYRSHRLNSSLKNAKVLPLDLLLTLWKSYRWSWRIKLASFLRLKKAGMISVCIFSTSLIRTHYPSLSQLIIWKYSWFCIKIDLHQGFQKVSEGICSPFSNSFSIEIVYVYI